MYYPDLFFDKPFVGSTEAQREDNVLRPDRTLRWVYGGATDGERTMASRGLLVSANVTS